MSTNQTPIEMLLITPKQVAEIMQVSERTVANWITARTLPSFKIGGARRIELDEVKALIKLRAEMEKTPQEAA
jgi:excisionase family DNA binding protein